MVNKCLSTSCLSVISEVGGFNLGSFLLCAGLLMSVAIIFGSKCRIVPIFPQLGYDHGLYESLSNSHTSEGK